MNYIGGLIGALVGGAIGAAVWAGITAATGYEIGWIAWGVGFAVGLGAAIGSSGEGGPPMGIVAVVVAVGSILAGKFIALEMIVSNELGDVDSQIAADFADDEYVISFLADDIAESWQSQGMELDWPDVPPGADEWYEPDSQEDYPANVWEAASTQWNDMGPDGQEQFRTSLTQESTTAFHDSLSMLKGEAYKESFSLFDLLFFGLAIITAYQVGQGGVGGTES